MPLVQILSCEFLSHPISDGSDLRRPATHIIKGDRTQEQTVRFLKQKHRIGGVIVDGLLCPVYASCKRLPREGRSRAHVGSQGLRNAAFISEFGPLMKIALCWRTQQQLLCFDLNFSLEKNIMQRNFVGSHLVWEHVVLGHKGQGRRSLLAMCSESFANGPM